MRGIQQHPESGQVARPQRGDRGADTLVFAADVLRAGAQGFGQALEELPVRRGTSFCTRKISIFMSKFVANENKHKFWVKSFHKPVKISLPAPGFTFCGMVKGCKPLPRIDWANSISLMCPKAS